MRSKWLSVIAVLGGLLLVAPQSEAGMLFYDVDLQDSGGGMVGGTTPLGSPVDIAAGEVMSLETNFTSGQTLQIDGAGSSESLFIGLTSNASSFSAVSDVLVTFLGFSGTNGASATYSAPLATTPAFGNQLGVVLSDFLADNQSISFTGYTVDFTVDTLDPTPQTYVEGSVVATNANVITPVAVPEPGTYAMFGIGIMAIGMISFWKYRHQADPIAI